VFDGVGFPSRGDADVERRIVGVLLSTKNNYCDDAVEGLLRICGIFHIKRIEQSMAISL